MRRLKIYLNLTCVLVASICVQARLVQQNVSSDHLCHLLDEKFTISSPWVVYPIVYDPVNRGRLTIWTGTCTLPTSEFKCYASPNDTNDIILDFASFASKFDWTLYDSSKGATYHGSSVNYHENIRYRISLTNKQARSYSDCNTVSEIQQLPKKDYKVSIQSACPECNQHLVSLLNSELRELVKSKFDAQIIDNLYWQLTQLISNQHFSGPTSLMDSDLD